VTPWPLSVAFPLAIVASIAIVLLFDVLSAMAAARHSGFPYRKLWPVQLVLYIVIGFCAMFALLDLRRVEAVGAITGVVEWTLGWAIVWRIGPGRVESATPGRIAVVVLSMTAFGFGFALLGAVVFNVVVTLMLRAHG